MSECGGGADPISIVKLFMFGQRLKTYLDFTKRSYTNLAHYLAYSQAVPPARLGEPAGEAGELPTRRHSAGTSGV